MPNKRALTVLHAEGSASELSPASRRGTVERSSDNAQGAPRGADSSPSRLSAESRRGTVEPSEGDAQGSRRGTAQPGVDGVQASVPGTDVSPSRLGSGSQRETAERGRVSCLCKPGVQGAATPSVRTDNSRCGSCVGQSPPCLPSALLQQNHPSDTHVSAARCRSTWTNRTCLSRQHSSRGPCTVRQQPGSVLPGQACSVCPGAAAASC